MTEKITNAYNKVCEVCTFIASIGLLMAIIVTFAQVVLRSVFYIPLPWAEEFVRYILIISASLGITLTSKLDRLAAVNLFYDRLKPMTRYYWNIILYAVTFAVCAVLVWQGIKVTISRIPMSAVSMNISMAVYYAAIPITGFLLMFSTLVKLLNNKKPVNAYAQSKMKEGDD